MRQTLGVIGGRPNAALYFVGKSGSPAQLARGAGLLAF